MSTSDIERRLTELERRIPQGMMVSSTFGRSEVRPFQVGFPAVITSTFDADTGYSWSQLVLDQTGPSIDSPDIPRTGDMAFTPDNNENLPIGTPVWLEVDPQAGGWIANIAGGVRLPIQLTSAYSCTTGYSWQLLTRNTGSSCEGYSLSYPAVTGQNLVEVGGNVNLQPGWRAIMFPDPTVPGGWLMELPGPSSFISAIKCVGGILFATSVINGVTKAMPVGCCACTGGSACCTGLSPGTYLEISSGGWPTTILEPDAFGPDGSPTDWYGISPFIQIGNYCFAIEWDVSCNGGAGGIYVWMGNVIVSDCCGNLICPPGIGANSYGPSFSGFVTMTCSPFAGSFTTNGPLTSDSIPLVDVPLPKLPCTWASDDDGDCYGISLAANILPGSNTWNITVTTSSSWEGLGGGSGGTCPSEPFCESPPPPPPPPPPPSCNCPSSGSLTASISGLTGGFAAVNGTYTLNFNGTINFLYQNSGCSEGSSTFCLFEISFDCGSTSGTVFVSGLCGEGDTNGWAFAVDVTCSASPSSWSGTGFANGPICDSTTCGDLCSELDSMTPTVSIS